MSAPLLRRIVSAGGGSAEAMIPDTLAFNQMLGVDEAKSMAAPQATIKLGIDFHQYWLRAREDGATDPMEAYSLWAAEVQRMLAHGEFLARYCPADAA